MMDKNDAKKILNTPYLYKDACVAKLRGDKYIIEELIKKECALYNYYGFEYDPNKNARFLALSMAFEKFKCFRITDNRVGRPSIWKGDEGIKLWVRVLLKKIENPKCSTRSAISNVMKQYKYSGSLDSLYVRYSEVDKNNNATLQAIRQMIPNIAEKTNDINIVKEVLSFWAK